MSYKTEQDLQNIIRASLNKVNGFFFRVNCGMGWTGNSVQRRGRSMVINNARPFSTGLPPGTSDLIGITEIEITPDMVGQKIGVFTGIEIKVNAKLKPNQKTFINNVKNAGGFAGVARSVDDALKICKGQELE